MRGSNSFNVIHRLTPQREQSNRVDYLIWHTGEVGPPYIAKNKSVAGPNIKDKLISNPKTMTAVENVKSEN